MKEKPRTDLFDLSMTIYELSVSRNLFSKTKMRQFGASETDGLIIQTFCSENKRALVLNSSAIFMFRINSQHSNSLFLESEYSGGPFFAPKNVENRAKKTEP